jgi:putative oxidoreductase
MDLGILIIRVVVGLALAAHGSQKLFGWFGGGGLEGTQGMMDHLGFRPARLWGSIAAVSEFGGGLLLAAGLLSPLGSLAIAAAMLTAVLAVHLPNGFWNSKGGFELPLVNLAAAAGVAVAGPGRYSVDALLGIALPEWVVVLGIIALVAGLAAAFASRRIKAAPPQAQGQQA